MALVLADRVRETTTTTGTGTISLAGPVSGFEGFGTAIGNANTTYYAIVDAATGAWEVGLGTYTSSGSTLARTTILSSSNAGAAVNFAAGTKDVFVTQPAERALYLNGAGTGVDAGAAAFTANGVVYASSTSALATGSALVFDGTNLGVGNTSPSSYNAAADNLVIGSSGSNGMTIVSGTTGAGYIMFADGTVGQQAYEGQITYDHASNFMAFNTSGTERARISSDGTFRVKGAGTAGSTDAFQVAGTAPADAARIDSSGDFLVGTTTSGFSAGTGAFIKNAVSSNTYLGINHNSASTSGADFAAFGYNGTQIGGVAQVGTTAVIYNTTSDYRLKTVVGPVANAGQRIDALQPVEYTWNSNGSSTRGFLAHQFQEVYAGSVTGTKDAVDAEGKPVYQSMQASTSEVIADLVAELQSLRARVASLESSTLQ